MKFPKKRSYLKKVKLTIALLRRQLALEQEKSNTFKAQLKHVLDLLNANQHKLSPESAVDLSKKEILFYKTPLYQGISSEWTKMSPENWLELIEWIDNQLVPDFTYRLKHIYPGITESELHICYLTRLNIPVKRIAILLCITSQGVSTTKNRLCTKLTGRKGGARDLDKFLSDF